MDLTPDHLEDEILSALLDGDAAEAGSDAAVHLGACDRCGARQAALEAAREALAAAPVEPLDELTRRRVVAAALEAAGEAPAAVAGPTPTLHRRSGWISRHPAFIGSVAAAVLAVLVGVPFVVGDGSGGGGDTTLSADAPALQESASPYLGDLGDLGDRDRLRLRLAGSGTGDAESFAPQEPGASPAGGASTPAPVPAAAPTGGGLSSGFSSRAGPETLTADAAEKASGDSAAQGSRNSATDTFTSDPAAGRDRADTDACVAALLNGPARGGRLTASGTGTYQDRPAIVAAFELSGGTVAFVADRSGCAVLDRFSL